MRFIPPVLLTACFVFVVVGSFLPWGFMGEPGKENAVYTGLNEPLEIAGLSIPNWLVATSIGFATLLVWLRAVKFPRIPWPIPLLLSIYACVQIAWFYWVFATNRALMLGGAPTWTLSLGAGIYCVAVGSVSAAMVCLVDPLKRNE